ncbi:MAG: phosphodiester glycosidase family protein [Solirubrobacterales bacterium]
MAQLESLIRELADGRGTTIHVARFERSQVRPRVVALNPPGALADWCAENDIANAMIGGFFIRSAGTPLGELRIDGEPLVHAPFDPPWNHSRACLQISNGDVRFAPRSELGDHPEGDMLQAGPMLARDGRGLVSAGSDPEGFSAGSRQFDSDITAGRYPRAALGAANGQLIAAVCDGRTDEDAGLTLDEMAEAMIELGASDAINLDGGGSASLVIGGVLRNQPREEHGIDIPEGRPVSTALAFVER